MAPTPGILYVTMQPKPDLPIAQFHDWYNNEHGPNRLRLPFVKNGFRYRATDLDGPGKGQPEWMAIYDIMDMAELQSETYTQLRKEPVQSQRERDTMKKITVDRKFFDYVESREAKEFRRLEGVDAEGEENVMVAVSVNLFPGDGKKEELDKWYSEEHMPMLSKVPGWLRTRRYVTSSLENREEMEYLALHEYAPMNGLGGPEFKEATSTPWNNEIFKSVVRDKRRRVYELYYTFGAGPRDLSSLSSPDAVKFTSTDGQTRTLTATSDNGPAIESYAPTSDGEILLYRLEGSTDPQAPLIVLSNSILVTWGIWDRFVVEFFSDPQNKKYRILRYHTRGRTSNRGASDITVDVLASDIIALLDALRVPRAAAVIGVSLGGATALNTALKYPARVGAFVSCDTNAKSPEGNKKTWEDRIAVAEKEGAKGPDGGKVVGEQLAEMTVKRWFANEGGNMEAEMKRVKTMVAENSLEGFESIVQALFAYDFEAEMKSCGVKGAFVVGGEDGVLPRTMKEMADGYGSGGAEYVVIDGVGHLPMVEKPREFAEVVTRFLSG